MLIVGAATGTILVEVVSCACALWLGSLTATTRLLGPPTQVDRIPSVRGVQSVYNMSAREVHLTVHAVGMHSCTLPEDKLSVGRR